MEEKIRVFEVEKEIINTEKEKQRFILKFEDDEWLFHSPEAQDFTQQELEIVVTKLQELNKK